MSTEVDNTISQAVAAPRGMETLMGGVAGTARLKDQSTQNVWIRQLEIEEYPRLLGLLGDERGMLELYCLIENPKFDEDTGKPDERWRPAPAGWARQLTADSHGALIEKAEELNADFFWRWLRRHLQRIERVQPGLTERMFGGLKAALEAAQPKGASPATSPKSPLNAG